MSPLVKPVSLLTREANTSSIDLDKASNQYLQITDAAQNGALDLSGDFTVEWWYKADSFPVVPASGVVSKWLIAGQLSYFIRYRSTGPVIDVYISQTGVSPQFDHVTFDMSWFGTGVWTHFALSCDISEPVATQFTLRTYSGGTVTDRGNGTVISNQGVTSIKNGTSPFDVGIGSGNPGRNLDGLLDDLRVWNVVRSAAQIDANRNHQLAGNEPGLVAYYKFNDNPNDSTANGNDLTPVNGPTYSTDVPFT